MDPALLREIFAQLPMVGLLLAAIVFYEKVRAQERDRYFDLWTNHMTKSNESLAKAVTLLEIIEQRVSSQQ